MFHYYEVKMATLDQMGKCVYHSCLVDLFWHHWTPLKRCGCQSGNMKKTEHVPSTGRPSRRSLQELPSNFLYHTGDSIYFISHLRVPLHCPLSAQQLLIHCWPMFYLISPLSFGCLSCWSQTVRTLSTIPLIKGHEGHSDGDGTVDSQSSSFLLYYSTLKY